jgi:hypothetical protein
MKIRLLLASLGLLFALPALGQQCGRLQFLEVDSDKVYAPGQKIKHDEAHGVYTGLLSADSIYFFCPVTLTVTKRGSLAKFENYEDGSLTVLVRRATDRQWTKKVLPYRCENRLLNPGKMEYVVFNGQELEVGSHDSLCLFSKSK